jgi:hypothetical protein
MSEEVQETQFESKRRRSQGILLSVPVLVQAGAAEEQPCVEETQTLVVNAHGALIALTMKVEFGQALRVKNRKSQEEQQCRVAFLGSVHLGKTQVGVEFVEPAPQFWHINFPPEDWTPYSPESRVRPRA